MSESVKQFLLELEVEEEQVDWMRGVSVRFHETEVAMIDAWARRYGFSRAEFIRRSMEFVISEAQKIDPLSTEELKAAYKEADAE